MPTCKVAGCEKSNHGYSHYCNKHHMANVRHGHPCQRSFRLNHLNPHYSAVRDFLKARPGLTEQLEAIWMDVVEEARCVTRKTVCRTWERDAAKIILNVAGEVPAYKVVHTVLAMAYAIQEDPRAFMSDRAAIFQVARRFVALTHHYTAKYYSHRDGRTHYVRRELGARTSHHLGLLLLTKFGAFGFTIHSTLLKKAEAERERVNAAFSLMREEAEAA